MKKVMKRGFSLVLTLLMLLCLFPVSALAADEKCTLTVGKDSAAVRAEAHNYGKIVERYAKGKSVTYTHLRINDALNLWYGIPIEGTSDYKYIYSGNVQKISTPKGNKVTAQVEMSTNLLLKDNCRAQAQKLLDNGNTGYSKEEMAREIFAHAYAYYMGDPIVESKAKLYLTDAVLCTFFPETCVTTVTVTTAMLAFAKYARDCGICVEIGEDKSSFEGIGREKLYQFFWNMTPD